MRRYLPCCSRSRELSCDEIAIVLEVAVEGLNFLLVDNVEAVAKGAQEVFVVTNDHEAALKVVQSNN